MLQKGILYWEGAPCKYDLLFNDGNCGRGDWRGKGRAHVQYLLIKSSDLSPSSAVFITPWFGLASPYYRDQEIPALDSVRLLNIHQY